MCQHHSPVGVRVRADSVYSDFVIPMIYWQTEMLIHVRNVNLYLRSHKCGDSAKWHSWFGKGCDGAWACSPDLNGGGRELGRSLRGVLAAGLSHLGQPELSIVSKEARLSEGQENPSTPDSCNMGIGCNAARSVPGAS
jgi:hypothetical protein